MEKSKATTSKMVDSTSATCKGCKKVLSDSNKLRHITHTTCRQHYSKEEMNHFRDLAAERKSLKEKEYYSKNKESIRAKREEKLEQSKRNRQDPLTLIDTCKSCNKTFPETSILKHITHSKSCLKQYNEEFEYEFGFLRYWAEQQKKDWDVENFTVNKASIYAKQATRRTEMYEKKKAIRDQLTETCKSCKKKFWDTSFLKHIGQKQSCKEEYTDEELDFMTGWAKERKRLYNIDYREENKEALALKRSQRNKEQKEKKKEEIIAKSIQNSKRFFRSSKLRYERNARIENKIAFDVGKNNFFQVFQTFQTYALSEKDSKKIGLFKKRFQDMFDKFESEIDQVAANTKDMEYEYDPDLIYTLEQYDKNPEKYNHRNDSFSKLEDMWSNLMRPNYQIRNEWHDLCLNVDLTLKEIAKKLKKPYEWESSCFCDECLRVKSINAKEEKKLRKKMKDKIFASGKYPKLS